MELKITKEEYKSHPFPTKLLILFIIFSIVGIVCVEIVANLLIRQSDWGALLGCLGTAGVVLLILFFIVTSTYTLKIYRGRGFYRTLNLLQFLIIISIIIVILYFNNVVKYFDIIPLILIIEFTLPFVCSMIIKGEYQICRTCGLLNSIGIEDIQTTRLGTRVEFYNYGNTAYIYEKGESTIKYKCKICGTIKRKYGSYEKRV